MALNDSKTYGDKAYKVVFEGNCPDKATSGLWQNTVQILEPVNPADPWVFTDNVWAEDVKGTQAEVLAAMASYLQTQYATE